MHIYGGFYNSLLVFSLKSVVIGFLRVPPSCFRPLYLMCTSVKNRVVLLFFSYA